MGAAALEALEPRTLLATIEWDGGPLGTGTNFHDAANWDGDVLPGAADDAVIPDVPGTPTITISQSATLNSLTSAEELLQTGGMLTLAAASEFASGYSLSSGAVAGAGDLTITGAMSWTAGTMSGTGQTIIAPGASLSISGAVVKQLQRTLVIDGTATWSAGTVAFDGGTMINNGVFGAAASGTPTARGDGGINLFQNNGAFIKSGAGDFEVRFNSAAIPFDNSAAGAVSVEAGRLQLRSGGMHEGEFTIDAAATLELDGSHSFAATADISGGGSIALLGDALTVESSIDLDGAILFSGTTVNLNGPLVAGSAFTVESGTVSINGAADFSLTAQLTFDGGVTSLNTAAAFPALASLTVSGGDVDFGSASLSPTDAILSGGELTGSGDLAVSGTMSWTDGTMSGSGQTTIAPGASLTISGSSVKHLHRTLVLNGTATWSAGTVAFDGGTLINNGVLNAAATGSPTARGDAGMNLFQNTGSIVKSGAGDFEIRSGGAALPFVHTATGIVTVEAGRLQLTSGGAHEGDFVLSGPGLLQLNGGHTFAATVSITGDGSFQVLGGAVGFDGSINLTGTATFSGSGTSTFTAGFGVGNLVVSAGTLTGSADLVVNGNFSWTGGTFTGAGTLILGVGPAWMTGATLTLGRELIAHRAITQTAGTLTLNGASDFNGLYTLSGGTLTGSGDFAFNGGLTWSGGATLGGSGLAVLPAGQTISLTAGATLARSLDNFGIFNNTSASTFALNQNAVLTNRSGGVFNHDGAGVIYGFGPWAYFVNEGVYNKNTGVTTGFQHQLSMTNAASGVMNIAAGTWEWSNADQFGTQFTNQGQISAATGAALRFLRGAIHADGSTITGAGSIEFNSGPHAISALVQLGPSLVMSFTGGDVTLNQSRAFAHPVTLSGGALLGSGDFTFNAGLNWSGGTLGGSGLATIAAGQVLTHTGSNGLRRSLDNFGTINSSAGVIVYDGSVLTIKAGAIFNAGPAAAIRGLTNASYSQFVNHGTYNKNGGGTFGFTDQVVLTNSASGVMNINAGTLEWSNSDQFGIQFYNSGQIDVDAGTTFRFTRGASHGPGSSITGAGTVEFNSGPHVIPETALLDIVMTFTGANVTLNQSRTFTHPVTLSGGSLGGSGNFTFAAGLNWSGGTHSGTGLTIIPAGQMLVGTASLSLNRNLDNFGTVMLAAGSFSMTLAAGAVFTNKPGAVFEHNSTGGINGSGDPGVEQFTNQGTYNKNGAGLQGLSGQLIWDNTASGVMNINAGTLELTIDWSFTNNGLIDLDAGTLLRFNRDTSHAAGSSIVGAGAVHFNGFAHVFTGHLLVTGAIGITGGTVTLNSNHAFAQSISLSGGTLTGSGDLTFGGGLTWSGGTLTGSGRAINAPGQTVERTGSNELSRHFDNFGTFNFSGTNSFNFNGAIVFTNKPGGVFNHVHAGSLRGLGASPQFINQGVYNKVTSGTFGLTDNLVFTNATGGVVNVNAGTFTLQNAGGFSNNGTLNVLAGTTATVSVSVSQISASTLNGGTWNVGGTLTFPAGTTITTIGAAAGVRLSGPAAAINKSGGGSALATLGVNNGELTLHDGAPWAFKPAGGVFFNNGTFNVTGVGTVSVPSHVTFNNGAAGALGGTLNIGDPMRGPGPTIEFGPFDGGGVININATVAFNQDFEIFAIINLFTPGTLTGTGNILVSGTFNWFGGAQTGTGSTSVGSGNTLNMFGDGVMTLARGMSNLVAGSWTGGCLLLDGGQFANSMGATFTISGTVEVLSAGAGDESFSNAGDMMLTGGSDVTFGTDLAVSNTGTLVIESFVFFAEDEAFDGNIELAAGGELAGPGNLTFLFGFVWTGGTMSGTGTTTIDAAATLMLGNGNMTLSRTLENFSVAGSWTGGCLLMAGGIFNNNAGASLDIFADPRIDVLGISGTNEFNNHGLITVHTGEFVIGVPGTNTGTIIVIPPDTLIFMAPWIYLPGSSLEGPGGVIFGGGMHSFPVGTFGITGPIGLDTGATLVLPASSLPNYNAATNTFSGGSWTIGAGAQLFLNGADIRTIGPDTTFTLMGDAQLAALANLSRIDGALHLEDGATLAINPDASGSALINNGHLRIGPGSTLDIAGSYQQASLATLHIGIAGTANALMGRLLLTGSAALGGSFELTYENSFAASRGEEFRVIQSSGPTGAFSMITAPPPPAGDLKAPVLIDSLGVRHLVTHIADWDNDLVVTVPDIFSFLTAWFAGDAAAQQFGGSPGVPAIFAFLAAWFAA